MASDGHIRFIHGIGPMSGSRTKYVAKEKGLELRSLKGKRRQRGRHELEMRM